MNILGLKTFQRNQLLISRLDQLEKTLKEMTIELKGLRK